jgi:endogenous inhibitor of DNA gyrase (YacG/DUF329 family)
MIPRIGEGRCVTCGQPFAIPANNPHRRFCSPRCRVADWHAHHGRPRANDVPGAVPPTNDVPDDVPRPNGVPAVNGVQRCPHCKQEIAVISVVIPATAAHVRTPEVMHMDPS